jgi:predicted lipoprotein with Yx(FWY)xxD motif
MRNTTIVWIVIIILVLLGVWYFLWPSAATAPSASLGTIGNPNQTNTGGTAGLLGIAHDPTLGDFLVAADGMTLYSYTNDDRGVSNCTDSCAINWPPYTVPQNEPIASGVTLQGDLGTFVRSDGTIQLTYNGMPLYFYKQDVRPGDKTGENMGNVWFVVRP